MTYNEQSLDRVTVHLKHGRENATSTHDLLPLTGFQNIRDLRKFIEARRRDTVILSCVNGYYLPDTDPEKGVNEVKKFISVQNSRIRAARRTTEAAAQYIKQYEKERDSIFYDSFIE